MTWRMIQLWQKSAAQEREERFARDYEKVSRQLIKQPTRLGEPTALYGNVDEWLPHDQQEDLQYFKVEYVARKPKLDAPYSSMEPVEPIGKVGASIRPGTVRPQD